nr:hypothetical protein [Lachnospiraceae bacterium]
MVKKKYLQNLLIILGVVLLFACINIFLYVKITSRLANNFSGVSKLKMIDVSRYLPFEEASTLARTGSSLKFDEGDDLPVLDG